MAEFERVEIPTPEDAPFSEQDIKNLEQEEQTEIQEEQLDDERPEWLPEKFESPEELAKAYSDLQAEFTRNRQNEESGREGVEKAAENAEALSVESFKEFSDEFNETGDVSQASRDMIVKNMGLPREMVDAYVEGQKALLNTQFDNIYGEVGGEDNYNEMLRWANENLSESDKNVFDDAVTQGSNDQMMFAIRNLAARWRLEGGSGSAPLIQGSTSSTGAGGGYRSLAELTQAMGDPRYSKDPAYRQDVQTRLANSNIM